MSVLRRTVILHSVELNRGKFTELAKLIDAYASQKDDFLVSYAHVKFLDVLRSNKLRDALVSSGFASPFGLKARSWKLASKGRYAKRDVALIDALYFG